MTNDEINQKLGHRLRQFGLPMLENQVVDRDGRLMDLSRVVWKFNVPTRTVSFDWHKLAGGNIVVIYALRLWLQQQIRQQAARTAMAHVQAVANALHGGEGTPISRRVTRQWNSMRDIVGTEELADALRVLLGFSIENLRATKRMEDLYCLRQWFYRSSDLIACLGFDEEFALELDRVHIPSRESGIAVELEDEESGPLWDVELLVLQHALLEDQSSEREHVMQRAAVALGLAFGRNPSNYCLLREEDFKNELAGFDVPPQWILSIPRIKKPGVGPRTAFVDERLDDKLVRIIHDLIESNSNIECGDFPRPLFMRTTPSSWFDETGVAEYKFHLTTDLYGQLLTQFVERLDLKSPRTGRRLCITSRRLRYSFATAMVERGVAKRTLAMMLDHSDTQHVRVYYSLKGTRMTRILDQAAALRFGPLMKLFRGEIISSAARSENERNVEKTVTFYGDINAISPLDIGDCGKKKRCELDPPFSCYCCPLFRPYVEADHGAVLNELLASREVRREKYSSQIAVQLDDVIYAIGEVIREVAAYARRKGVQA